MAIALKVFFLALLGFALTSITGSESRQAVIGNTENNIAPAAPANDHVTSSLPVVSGDSGTNSTTTNSSNIVSGSSNITSETTHSNLDVNISNNSSNSSSSINIDTGSTSGQTNETPGVSGIKGTINISPACAINQTKCTLPFIRQIIITNSSGAEVARVPSGNINVKLAPGTYTLSPVKSTSNTGHFSQTYAVTVYPNMFASLNISISGN